MFRKLSIFLLILAMIPGLAFSQGAKEIADGEEIAKVISVSQSDDGVWMIDAQAEDGTEKVYIVGSDTEVEGLPVQQLSAGDFIAVKGTGISTMSLPPQLPTLSVRYITPLVQTGTIEADFAPLSHPGLIIQIAEVDADDLKSAFSYSYGYLCMEALKAEDVYPNGGYFARGILDAGDTSKEPLISIEEMNTVLTDYIANHIQKGLPVRYGDVVSTREAVEALGAPASADEEFAYAYGYFTTLNLFYSGVPISVPEFADGTITSLYGASQLFTAEEMQGYVNSYIQQLQQEYQEYVAELAADNLAKAEAFLADNAAREGIITLESGVQIEFINDSQEEGAVPAEDSDVVVDYKLTDMDGNVMDQGEGVEFNLQSLIPGFSQAVLQMTVGDSIKAYIPPALGYGESGTGSIEPNSLLIFDITLDEVL